MGELYYLNSGNYVEIEKLQQNELHHYINSPLTTPSLSLPIYVNTSSSAIQVYPITITSGVTCNYISRPATVKWAYTVVFEQAMYNANNSVNFELHDSEETELVMKILSLAGVMLKDPSMYQIASTEDQKSLQQEKQ